MMEEKVTTMMVMLVGFWTSSWNDAQVLVSGFAALPNWLLTTGDYTTSAFLV